MISCTRFQFDVIESEVRNNTESFMYCTDPTATGELILVVWHTFKFIVYVICVRAFEHVCIPFYLAQGIGFGLIIDLLSDSSQSTMHIHIPARKMNL